MTTAPSSVFAAPTSPGDAPLDAVGEGRGIGGRLVVTLLGGVLLVVAFAAGFAFDPIEGVGGTGQNFHAAVAAIAAALLLGVPIVIDALRDVWAGRMGVSVLAAVAVVAAFAEGLYPTAGWIAFFMTLSTLIESRTALGARRTIERLLRLTPGVALLVDGDTERVVQAKDLRPGDVVRVRPGDNLPGDGTIVRGQSSINQANITGESLPVDVDAGADVFGGTTNLTGLLDVRITHAGRDTTLGRVQDLVLQAEQSKTATQRLADAYASYHVPTMLMVAAVVWFFTVDTERFVALLIVASPAGIILATPTAMVAALSAAARLGILVKDVAVLERARNLSAVVLDKTGTLTTGRLSVTRLAPVEGVEPAELLGAAVAVERNSTHPVARAVVAVAERARVVPDEVSNFTEAGGLGVRASAGGGGDIVVGREAWLVDNGVEVDLPPDKRPPDGLSVLYVARGGRLLGWIGLEDKVRDDAAASVALLKAQGVRQVVMVTGDRWGVARRVAAETGCTDVQGEVLPADKLKVVEGLRQKGHIVAVVGDGVNDAPALAAGDLSIAMGAAGSDVAISSATVALMNNRLDRVPFLQRLARASGRVIVQGIAISLGFIVVFGILAAAGLIDPILAAALHALSSIVVVFNSARLVRQGEDLDATPVDEAFEQRLAAARDTITPQPVTA